MSIKPSCDSKVRMWKTHKNTFGLLPGKNHTCPGATEGKGGCVDRPNGRKTTVCYVDKFMCLYPNVGAVLKHNTELLDSLNESEKSAVFDAEFKRSYDSFMKRSETAIELRGRKPVYRITWAGDIKDEETARAIRDAMDKHPNMQFWLYTRTFNVLPIVAGAKNCSVYVSTDDVNKDEAMAHYHKLRETHSNIHFACMSTEQPPDTTMCPTSDGSLEHEGACPNCMMCVNGTANVWFPTR